MLRIAELAKAQLGYLRNTRRGLHETCQVCTAPIDDSYTVCYACSGHRAHPGIADRVGAVAYAWYGHQSGRIMEGYKGRAGQAVRHNDVSAVALLGLSAIGLHTTCAELLAGLPVTHWAVVPSLPRRDGDHPLQRVVRAFAPGVALPLIAATEASTPRALSAAHFRADRVGKGSHVLILDDTWTTGGHAQSAALAVRAAGAQQVSILVLARWLKLGWPPTDAFLPSLMKGPDFDPAACPWTGDTCPG